MLIIALGGGTLAAQGAKNDRTGRTADNGRAKTKVACVGNSVTFGYKLPNRATQAYPVRLQELLGEGYEVRNFGHSGATLLNKGHRPYTKLPEWRAALDFAADRVIIHLGLNDTDPRNWPEHQEDFIADYTAVIDSFKKVNPKADIWICRMTPIFHDHPRFDSGTREWHAQIQKKIEQIARTNPQVKGLIDLYEPLHKFPNLFPDALHPDSAGALILAETVYKKITGAYGPLKLGATWMSGMVVQRNKPVEIEGSANAGEKVSVEFAGMKRVAIADDNGKWSVTLPAMEAGGPYVLEARAKSGRVRCEDVWTGEVWLCSGQSNMELRLREIATAREDIAAARNEERLHLYNMPAICATYAFEWSAERLDSVNKLLYVLPGKWQRCKEADVANFSAIAYHFGRHLADSLGCHVGLISNAVGGATCESWIDRSVLEADFPAILRNWKHNDFIQPWARNRAALNCKQSKLPLQRHPYEPGYLFDNAIRPLRGTALAGVLWYQGESNAHNIEAHERLFPLLEKSWRAYFDAPELPFYTVQLSSIGTRRSWPQFRNSQRLMAARLPHTYLAVTSDLGDSLNVHPTHKAEVGERLALLALRHAYGREGLTAEGPSYEGMRVEGTEVVVRFSSARGLRAAVVYPWLDKNGTARGSAQSAPALTGFEIAGADGRFHPAAARIEGETVRLSSPRVAAPKSVRYGWQPFTRANLVNGAGLPASTFRSE